MGLISMVGTFEFSFDKLGSLSLVVLGLVVNKCSEFTGLDPLL